MKKFFFLAVAVTAMLTACSKTEITPIGEAQEIAFTAVNKVATKVPVDGTEFLDNDNMYVTAYIVNGSETDGNFFSSTLFSKKGNGNWTGNPARYWPLTTSTINFLAVTKIGGNAENSQTSFNTPYASGATVTLNDNSGLNQNDLMFAAAQGTHTQGSAYTAVNMTFKHALSWVNFKFKKSNSDNCKIKINSVKLNGAVYNGTLHLSNGQYNEENSQNTEKIEATWTPGEATDGVKVPNADGDNYADPIELTNTGYTAFGNGLLVVPGYAESFTINYTLTQEDGTANTYDYTYKLPNGKWEMAKKYFYNIIITLTEIEVTPSITDWADQTPVDVNLNGSADTPARN